MTNKSLPILLIEDNPADAFLVKNYLADASVRHDLYTTDTLYEGIDLIRERGDIQMILLDLTLPDSAGFKTLTSLMERVSGVPVIVMTGINNEIVGNQAVKAGAQDFLVKGQFDGKLLGRSIRYAQQRFREQQKLQELVSQLSISEKRYADAEAIGHFGNWQMDIVSNEMTWTEQAFKIFGLQQNMIVPTLSQYMAFVHHEDRPAVDDFFESATKSGQPKKVEHRIVIDGTRIRHLMVSAKINFEESSGRILLVGVMQDVTERKVSEQLVFERNVTQKSTKMREEVLADMGFHIRTPLSSIVNLMFLLDNTAISSQQKELLEGLRTSVDDISIIINNLLNLSILSTDKMKIEEEPFVFRDFMASLKKLVQIKADSSNIFIEYSVDKEIPEKLIGDSRKLTQIFYNILSNSIRLSSKRESVSVQIGFREAENGSVSLHFSIIDRSAGIAPARLKELLNADNLVKMYSENDQASDEKMHEIGLAIVSKLVKTLGGHLDILSKEGSGMTYKFDVPMRVARTPRHRTGEVPTSAIRILLVEDHFLNQIATKKVLTAWSELVTVDIAENGLIGVEKYREHGYDIILMDLQMPVMGGIDSTRRIREQSAVPIIALTANSSRLEMDKCFESGMNDYLAKPFKPQELYAKIMGLVEAEAA